MTIGRPRFRGRTSSGMMVTLAFAVFGLDLLGQPGRWSRTPAYGNLLQIAGAHVWGVVYLAAAVLMGCYLIFTTRRWFAVIAHTATFILAAMWLVAFLIRWLTDSGTTVVNVVSWSVFTALVCRSAVGIDVADGGP